jgi:hypothetical protein
MLVGFIWLRIELVTCCFEHDDKPLVYMICIKFIVHMSDSQLLKKTSPPWSWLIGNYDDFFRFT